MLDRIKDKTKAQGALEYLLIIGGALLIAVIVIVLITSMNRSRSEDVKSKDEEYQKLLDNTILPPGISDVSCDSSTDEITVYISPSVTSGVKGYCLIVNSNADNYDNCQESSSILTFDSQETLTSGETYDISLVSLKNDNYSPRSKPSMTCKAE